MSVQIRLGAPGETDPGAHATVVANVRNDSDVVETYHLDVVGEPAAWAVIDPAALPLLPGDEASATITFRVPGPGLAPGGLVPWGLRARAESDPSACAVEESALSITGVTVLACELRPETARGRRRSQHRARIENRGNQPAVVSVTGEDKDEVLDVRVENGRFTLPPGGGKEVGIKVSSSDRGRAHHPFAIHVSDADGTTVELRGALDQRPLPKAAWRVPILVAAVLAALLMVGGAQVATSIHGSGSDEGATSSTTAQGSGPRTDPAASTTIDGAASPAQGPPSSSPSGQPNDSLVGPPTTPGQSSSTLPPPPPPLPPVQGVLYGIDPAGNLFWYRHRDPAGGGAGFLGPTKLGQGGWGPYTKVFSGGEGIIYAIDAAGKLYWYRHNDWAGGQQGFAAGVRKEIGSGWGPYTKVFSGGGGVIYAIDGNGFLFWYRHLDWAGGMGGFANGGRPIKLGQGGWGPYTKVFSGGGGVIYAIDAAGKLYWYRHNDWAGGQQGFAGRTEIGGGWASYTSVLSGGGGRIYATDADGKLYWYHHIDWGGGRPGFDNGGVAKVIGSAFKGGRWFAPSNQ